MSYLDWHIGMKVVCVNASGFESKLAVGQVYTVHSLDGQWVRLTDPTTWGLCGQETAGYRYPRFRPVQTRKTDIGVFTSMLTDTKQKVRA